jgi:hypothetical protein
LPRKDRMAEFLSLTGQEAPAQPKSRVGKIVGDVGNVPAAPAAPPTTGQRFMAQSPIKDPLFTNVSAFVLDHLPAVMAGTAATAASVGAGMLAGPGAGLAAGPLVAGPAGMAGKEIQSRLLKGRPATGKERAGAAISQATAETVGSAVGGGINLGIGKPGKGLLRFLGGRIFPESAAMRDVAKEAGTRYEAALIADGYRPEIAREVANQGALAAEVSQGRVLDKLDNFITGGGFVGGKHAEFKELRGEALARMARDEVEALGPRLSPDELARHIGGKLDDSQSRLFGASGRVHEAISETVRTQPVPVKVKGVAGKGADEGLIATSGLNVPTKLQVVATGNETGLVTTARIKREFLHSSSEHLSAATREEIESLPDLASFDEVRRLRSKVGEDLERASSGPFKNKTAQGALKSLYGGMSEEMDTALKQFDQAMRRKHGGKHIGTFATKKVADSVYKEVFDDYDRRSINSLINFARDSKRGPEIGRSILNELTGPGNEERLARLRDIVGEDSDAWKGLRVFVGDRILEQAAANGGYSGKTLRSAMESVSKEPTMRAVLGPEYDRLAKTFRTIEFFQRTNRAGGELAANFGEARIMLGVVQGTQAIGGIAKRTARYALTASGLSKVLMSPALTDLLLKGGRTGLKTREGAAIGARILGALSPDDYTEEPATMSRDEVRARAQIR